jgi:hypothetical protein
VVSCIAVPKLEIAFPQNCTCNSHDSIKKNHGLYKKIDTNNGPPIIWRLPIDHKYCQVAHYRNTEDWHKRKTDTHILSSYTLLKRVGLNPSTSITPILNQYSMSSNITEPHQGSGHGVIFKSWAHWSPDKRSFQNSFGLKLRHS